MQQLIEYIDKENIMTAKKPIQNPQDSLTIGTRVRVVDCDTPEVYDYENEPTSKNCEIGTIVEHLLNGGVSVKFDDYVNAWDYSAKEAMKFERGC